MSNWVKGLAPVATLALATCALFGAAAPAHAALRVCADPGNMPLSNTDGQGFENKIAQVLAKGMGTTVEYYFRPTFERGLTRSTLDADQCDVMLDMPTDSEGVITTRPLYRTSFVFVYRNDRHYDFKTLDDPRLKKLKIGVYETSAAREALWDHGVRDMDIHYVSHNADIVKENQPSYQVQQVIDGALDVAAAWGPMAGYFRTMQHAPITLQPMNLLDNDVPLQFDMAIAVKHGNAELRDQLQQAMQSQQAAIRGILVEYGVPLVQCEDCVISGDLPAHGPYKPPAPTPRGPAAQSVSIAQLDDWLAHGSTVAAELNNAVVADDLNRVTYLLDKKHAAVNAPDPQGETPLIHAVQMASPQMVEYLVSRGADVNQRDGDGWTAALTAAYLDKPDELRLLAAHGADLNAGTPQNVTALGVATQYGKNDAALALIELGADPTRAVGEGGYTPLMLAAANNAQPLATALIKKGVDVNARNSGGVTALMIAAAHGHPDMVQTLMRAGADQQVKNDRGDTALSIARDKGNEQVIQLLGGSADHPGA